MIDFTSGNIFDSNAQALVNPVNCVGVMGAGLAKEFKRRFPENFRAYAAACASRELRPGRVLVVPIDEGQCLFVINVPTKRHWRDASRIIDIAAGLVALVDEAQERMVRSVAVPPLGCGLGGLSWTEVRPRMERAFAASPVKFIVYEPAS